MKKKIREMIEMPIGDLIPYEKNAKRHDEEQVEQIANSIKRFGFVQPVVIDKDNVIVIGHGRVLGAKKAGLETVPCLRAEDLNKKEIKALRLADNKLNESPWDFDFLNEELVELDGFGMEDFGFELDFDESEEATVREEDYEEPDSIEHRANVGDLWELGEHRLICGDSTDTAVIDRLMDGVKADMVFTDPPYNMNYCGAGFINEQNKNVRERIKDIIDFDPSGISYLATGKIASNVFIFTSKDLIKDYLIMFDGWAFNLLMWHKTNTPPMVNNNYFADTEYLLYFHKGKRIWNNGLKPIDKYKKYFVSAMGQGKKDAGADLHPTMKPVALISNEIEICSNKGGVVLDCFGGSGSTLIACEQLNRKCYMCELDPHYVDVIIDRWERLTGKKAVKLCSK